MKYIKSPQNATIKQVARLRTSKGRQEQRRFVIDGSREVHRAIQCGFDLEAIFIKEARTGSADTELAANDKEILEQAADVHLVAAPTFAKIAFGNRQEVVAVARTPSETLDLWQLPKPATIAVLDRIEKPGNVGAAMRSADGAGIDGAVVVEPVSDLFNPNAIRASLGTIFSLRVAVATFEEFRAWSEEHQFFHLLARCESGASHYDDAAIYEGLRTHNLAIVLGSEATGLGQEWSNVSNVRDMVIPMVGVADSLNVSSAAAVLFYEARKHRRSG